MFTAAGLAAFGQAAGGISSLAGALGLGGKQKRGPSFDDMLAFNRRSTFNTIRSAVQAGKENGIHPLAALGVQSPSLTPVATSGGQRGVDFEGMGQGIERAATAYMGYQDRKIMEASALLDLENKQLNNDILKSQAIGSKIALQRQGSTPNGALNDYLSKIEQPLGSATGAYPLHRTAFDQFGQGFPVYNDELGDNEILQAVHALRYTLPTMIQNSTNRRGKALANWIRGVRSHVRKTFTSK